MTDAAPLLSVRDLTVSVDGAGRTDDDRVDIVAELSLDVAPGETLAIVGESGCGKTTAALSMMGLQSDRLAVRHGSVRFDGVELMELSARARRHLRGGPMAMVFQDPMSSMNPLRTIGGQIGEALRIHQPDLSRADRRERVVDLLRSVGIPDPEQRATQHPHEFSGGMRQRAMIAMAIANQPRLLIADEPTTALDVTVQAQIIELLLVAKRSLDAALILVTHDLGLVGALADRVAVMYSGRIVEQGTVADILDDPQHPYTVGLLDSVPHLGGGNRLLTPIPGQAPVPASRPDGCAFHPRCPVGNREPRCRSERPELAATTAAAAHEVACFFPGSAGDRDDGIEVGRRAAPDRTLLEISDLHVHFPIRSGVLRRRAGTVRAVDGVSLEVGRSETLAVVGESGSGKTSLARAIVGLNEVERGSISVEGLGDVVGRTDDPAFRRRVQLVFQDPFASLNPRMTLGSIIAEPMRVHAIESARDIPDRVADLLRLVGLPASMVGQYPHQLSGGQRQRIGLARALALSPDLIILDEPVSALDVSVQAQILRLLSRLRDELGLAYVLIAHDLALVEQIADRVAVMYHGRVVELGSADTVLGRPRHPYTRALIASTPSRDAPVAIAAGEPPSPMAERQGCAFRTRCPHAIDRCATVDPHLESVPDGVVVACIRADEIASGGIAPGEPDRHRHDEGAAT